MAKMMDIKGNFVNVSNIAGIGVQGQKSLWDPNMGDNLNLIWIYYLDGGSFSFKIHYHFDTPAIIQQIWDVIGKDNKLIRNKYMILNKEVIANIATHYMDNCYLECRAEIHTTRGGKMSFDYESDNDIKNLYGQMR